MKTWPVEVTCSMTYEVSADDPETAREQAIELFLSDVVKSLDIDTEVMAALEGEGCGEQCPNPCMSPDDCPYCTPNGFCQLEQPWDECEEYQVYSDECEGEEDEDEDC